jgi:hypothetical protein
VCLHFQVYTQQLPCGASQWDLLYMAELADAYLLHTECNAAMAALTALPVDSLDNETVAWAFDPPGGMGELDSVKQLSARAREWVTQHLGDLELTLQDADKLLRLQQLPFKAVLALVSDASTKVHSEGTVVAAVALWLEARGLFDVTHGQKQQLAYAIRMVQLPFTYLGSALPRVTWLHGVLDVHHIGTITVAKGNPQACSRKTLLRLMTMPERMKATWRTWLGDPRPSSSCDAVDLRVVVPAADLHSCGRAGEVKTWASSSSVHWGGYQLQAMLQLHRDRTMFARLGLKATGTPATFPASCGLQSLPSGAVLTCTAECIVDGAVKVAKRDTGLWMDQGWQLFDGLVDMSAGWQPDLLAPYLHDGKLTVRLRITDLQRS